MKTLALFLLPSLLLAPLATAQNENPFVKPRDQRILDEAAIAFLDAGKSLVTKAADSTMSISYGPHRLVYGVVVAPNVLATKWSEIRGAHGMLRGTGNDGKVRALAVIKVEKEHDLALLSFTGKSLPVLKLTQAEDTRAGDFLFVPRWDGEVATAGVVSVLPRSLRTEDAGFLGVQMQRGEGATSLLVDEVVPGGAADLAGLRSGDTILEVDSERIETFSELRNVLKRSGAGQTVSLIVQRGDTSLGLDAVLQGQASPVISRTGGPGERLDPRTKRMQKLGLDALSRRSEGYPRVMQTDLDVTAKDCGAPVVNLDGETIGLVIARASRIKTYVLPADVIEAAVASLK